MSAKSWIKSTLYGPPGLRTRDIRRGLLKGLKFNVDVASKSMRLMGLDEREIEPVMRQLTERAHAGIDVGANDGWYSLFLASRPNIQRVIAIEPSEPERAALMKNLEANGPEISRKVEVVAKFAGDKDDDGWCKVASFMPQLTLPVLLKIDVDGGELDVLHGATPMLTTQQCLCVIETHTPELERDCIAYLQSLGYQTRIISNAWYRLFLPEQRPIPHNRWFVAAKEL